jgi:hypothetical protein
VTVVVVLEYRQYRRATTTSTALRLALVHTTFIVGGAAASTRSCIAIADKKIIRKHCGELDIDIGNGPVLLNKSRPETISVDRAMFEYPPGGFVRFGCRGANIHGRENSSGQPGGSGSEGSSRL